VTELVRRELWNQRLDEPDAAYRQFAWWRDQAPEARPPPSDVALAVQFDWAIRAVAFDQTRDLPNNAAGLLKSGTLSLLRTFAIAARKFELREGQSPDLTLTPAELLRLGQVAAGLPAIAAGLQPVTPAVLSEDTPPDVVEAILRARDFLLRSGD
jgi:hypothetical protein